jgi:hypothetical protein
MKTPINSCFSPASFFSTSEPPSMIPSPAIPSTVIAVSMALIAPMLPIPFRSLKSAPQRLQ